jgi:PAS domain S-box-containing protein
MLKIGSESQSSVSRLMIDQLAKETIFQNFEHAYVVINHSSEILCTHGDIAPFFQAQLKTENIRIAEQIVPELASMLEEVISKTIDSFQPATMPAFYLRWDGEQLLAKIEIQPMAGTENNRLFLVVFKVLDKIAPDTASQLNQIAMLKQAQKIAKLGSWEFDTNIKNVQWSEETYRIYGYDPSQNADACFKDVIRRKPSLEKEQFRRMLKVSIKSKKSYNYDIQVVTPQNEIKYAQIIGRPIEDEAGNVIKLHGTIMDITDRKITEEKLKATLQQKEVLLKEVYHRVKNNLAMVEGLLFLQKNLITDQKYVEIFDECEKRIHSMALVHRNLYQTENLNTININCYINELVQHIAMSFSRKNHVEVEIKVNTVYFDLNQAIPLGLITNELVTNSFKYAFKDVDKPRLLVSLMQQENAYEFIVKDNGPGFDMSTPNERNTLGISLVKMLTSDLNGQIFFDSKQGTETKIIF